MNEQDIQLLDDYFNGLLSPENAQAVEMRAASDAAFGREFDLRREMEAFPRRAAKRQVFSDTLSAVGTDFFKEAELKKSVGQPPMTARMTRLRWLAAAAGLALVAIAVWFITSTGSPSYRQYAQHAPLSLTVRGAAEQSAADAEAAFNSKDYATALSALDRLLAEQPRDPTALLYKGICLIELDRTDDARTVLTPVAAGSTALLGEATWYVALSFLKDKNTAACKTELQKIAPGDARYEQAQVLLKEL